jgi:hypothetical protein
VEQFVDTDEDLVLDVGEQLVARYEYSLRSDGRRDQVVEHMLNTDNSTFSDATIAWDYDDLGRLSQEVYASSVSGETYSDQFMYDLASNRSQMQHCEGASMKTTWYAYSERDALAEEGPARTDGSPWPDMTSTAA